MSVITDMITKVLNVRSMTAADLPRVLQLEKQRKGTSWLRQDSATNPHCEDRGTWVATIQNVAGKAVDWLIDNVLDQHGPARSARALEELNTLAASAPPGSRGVIFTPWLNDYVLQTGGVQSVKRIRR